MAEVDGAGTPGIPKFNFGGSWSRKVRRWARKFPWLEVIGINVFIEHALPFIAKQVWKETETHAENKKRKREAKIIFAEALGQLGTSANKGDRAVFKCINAFMAIKMHHVPGTGTSWVPDQAVTDQIDFQANCVAIGGEDVEKTKDFLRALAKLPDHDMRMNFLDDIGFIGTRAIDWREWVEGKGRDLLDAVGLHDWRGAVTFLRDRGITAAGSIADGARHVDAAVTHHDVLVAAIPAPGAPSLLDQSREYRNSGIDEIRAAWRRR